jgi:hypothetical protein
MAINNQRPSITYENVALFQSSTGGYNVLSNIASGLSCLPHVQSIDFSFQKDRKNVGNLGTKDLIIQSVQNAPDINFNVNTIEDFGEMFTNYFKDGTRAKGTFDSDRNFYAVLGDQKGFDTTGVEFDGKTVLGFGNCFLTNLSMSQNVNGLISSNYSFVASNVQAEIIEENIGSYDINIDGTGDLVVQGSTLRSVGAIVDDSGNRKDNVFEWSGNRAGGGQCIINFPTGVAINVFGRSNIAGADEDSLRINQEVTFSWDYYIPTGHHHILSGSGVGFRGFVEGLGNGISRTTDTSTDGLLLGEWEDNRTLLESVGFRSQRGNSQDDGILTFQMRQQFEQPGGKQLSNINTGVMYLANIKATVKESGVFRTFKTTNPAIDITGTQTQGLQTLFNGDMSNYYKKTTGELVPSYKTNISIKKNLKTNITGSFTAHTGTTGYEPGVDTKIWATFKSRYFSDPDSSDILHIKINDKTVYNEGSDLLGFQESFRGAAIAIVEKDGADFKFKEGNVYDTYDSINPFSQPTHGNVFSAREALNRMKSGDILFYVTNDTPTRAGGIFFLEDELTGDFLAQKVVETNHRDSYVLIAQKNIGPIYEDTYLASDDDGNYDQSPRGTIYLKASEDLITQADQIQSFDLNLPVNRSSIYSLGKRYATKRKPLYPNVGNLSFTNLISEFNVSGDSSSFFKNLNSDDSYDILLDTENTNGDKIQLKIEEAKIDQKSIGSSIGTNTSENFSFSFNAENIKRQKIVDEFSSITNAYSLQKVDANYTGYAVKIRRLRDSVEADVKFNSEGKVGLDSEIVATPSTGTLQKQLGGFLRETFPHNVQPNPILLGGSEGSGPATNNNRYKDFRNSSTNPFDVFDHHDNSTDAKYERTSAGQADGGLFLGGAGSGERIVFSAYIDIRGIGNTNTPEVGTPEFKIKTSIDNGFDVSNLDFTGSATAEDGLRGVLFDVTITGTGLSGNVNHDEIFLTFSDDEISSFEVADVVSHYHYHTATVSTWYDQKGGINLTGYGDYRDPVLCRSGEVLDFIEFYEGNQNRLTFTEDLPANQFYFVGQHYENQNIGDVDSSPDVNAIIGSDLNIVGAKLPYIHFFNENQISVDGNISESVPAEGIRAIVYQNNTGAFTGQNITLDVPFNVDLQHTIQYLTTSGSQIWERSDLAHNFQSGWGAIGTVYNGGSRFYGNIKAKEFLFATGSGVANPGGSEHRIGIQRDMCERYGIEGTTYIYVRRQGDYDTDFPSQFNGITFETSYKLVAAVKSNVKTLSVTLTNVEKSDNTLTSPAITVDSGDLLINGILGNVNEFQITTTLNDASFEITDLKGGNIFLTINTTTT